MKRIFSVLCLLLVAVGLWAQQINALDELKATPKKAYGNDYPYNFGQPELTKAPKGYKAFYISHYARHGSRYYWNDKLYKYLDTLMTTANEKNLLTPEGKVFYDKFIEAKPELMTGISELTQLGWEQHQGIARRMYNNFPDVFKKGGNIYAISSLSGRCVMSMSAFCQELTQCNPALEIREESSRFTLNRVVPDDKENPQLKPYTKMKASYEKNRHLVPRDTTFNKRIIDRVFTSTEGLPNTRGIAGQLRSLYTSLPNIYHEGMMGNIITDEEIVKEWEASNLGSYSWIFGDQNKMLSVLEDFLFQAQQVIDGKSDLVASLRFGHDSCIGPLTALMGLNGADRDPEDPFEVKNIYQNWQTCKACNIQWIFYSKKNSSDVLIKCLLNESEASLPVKTDIFPYYHWSDVYQYYTELIKSRSQE